MQQYPLLLHFFIVLKEKMQHFGGFKNVLFILLLAGFTSISCQQREKPRFSSSEVIELDSSIAASPQVESYISPLRDSVEAIMNEIIGQTKKEMFPERPGTALSNFIADLIRDAAKREIQRISKENLPLISVININGLRAPLPEGNITVENIYSLMPFENKMVILKLSGEQVTQLFNHIGTSGGDGIAGATFTFRNQQVLHPEINGNPLKNKQFYYVATSDYLASGGDHYTIFTKASEKHTSKHKIRDLIISHIRKLTNQGRIINPTDEKRVILE
jgi:2',3'-cyclic-nucleotide 2'-phosphodiesterase (5'-nucleotidase family)